MPPTTAPANPVRWPSEAIWQTLAPSLPGFTVEVLPQIDSTNSELMRRFRAATAAAKSPETLLLVAEQQSAGRGRLGRSWYSRAGTSLTFSIGLPLQPADWSGLSLAVGVSLADSLQPGGGGRGSDQATSTIPALQLKWPNDLWLDQRKLGGILVETASWGTQRYVVIGVGLNVSQPDPDLAAWGTPTPALSARPAALASSTASAPPEATAPVAATSLQALWPGVDAPWALEAVAAPLLHAVLNFETQGFAAFQARFAARDALAGRAVQLSDGTQGQACGVSALGALRVLTSDGMREVNSAEVSVRPLATGA
jgi:BirA family biotin operon repressor/biotin-[acetyl-CoA-carboxylase] ligase